MLKILLQNKCTFFVVGLLIVPLVGIRFLEQSLFYDPFLLFFKDDFQNKNLPPYNSFFLFLGILCRYTLNTVISLGIIYAFFKEKKLVQFAAVLYILLFVLLIALFFGLLHFSDKPDFMLLFYVRRFLIQPLFLVVFLPAFYYQKKVS